MSTLSRGRDVARRRSRLFDQRQLRKRWRYVGLFAEELMLCAARAEVGPLTQSFWVLWTARAGGSGTTPRCVPAARR